MKPSQLNSRIVLNLLGLTVMLNGLFMLLAIPFSIYYKEEAIQGILVAGTLTISLGFLMWFSNKNAHKHLQKKEGYLIVTLGWVMLTVTGALPYLFTGSIDTLADAIFETISGYSTTGASIFTDIEAQPKGILFWRSATHWIGGMGIIVLAVAILPILGIGGMQLFMAEAPGPSTDKLHPRITETAKRLWFIYFLMTLAQFFLLKIAGMNWYDAINHAMSTMSTGGFSTKNASLAHWNHMPIIQYIIIAFMFFAGTNFILIYFTAKGKLKKLTQNEEFKYYLGGFLVVSLILGIVIEYFQTPGLTTTIDHPMVWGSTESSFRHAAFQVISVLTSTGFVSADYTTWSSFGTLVIFSLFFVGASAGSTSGGVKIVRHIIILKNSFLELKKLLHPRAIIPVRYNGHAISRVIVFNILSFFVIYMFIFIISSVILSFLGLDFLSAIGATISCLGGVGPAFGELGPVNNYAQLSDTAKYFCSLLMLTGRLELFTVIILFTPFFWKKN